MTYTEYLKSQVPTDLRGDAFKPKLTHARRCEAFGLYKLGFPQKVLCHIYGISTATASLLASPSTKHYAAVKNEWYQLGEEQFLKKYIDEAAMQNALSVNKTIAEDGEAASDAPNKKANRKAGVHTFYEPDISPESEEWEIAWNDAIFSGAGWYIRCLREGSFYEEWTGTDNGSPFKTSIEAWKSCRERLGI